MACAGDSSSLNETNVGGRNGSMRLSRDLARGAFGGDVFCLQHFLKKQGSLNEALAIVFDNDGIERAKDLARHHGDLALQALEVLPECEERTSLELMVEYVLERIS